MNYFKGIILSLALIFTSASCSTQTNVKSVKKEKSESIQKPEGLERAYFASGCFWCVEAVFESVKGVGEVVSGYAGGDASNANYSAVSAGRTDHAEAVEVFYDPEVISYQTLLVVFFGSQDPTTPNQQGPDRGRQYRSSIFYKSEAEKKAAEGYIEKLTKEKVFDAPIVTEVVPFQAFYDAEEYHQDFEKRNPNQGYVKAVSVPRLKRFQSKFPELLKDKHQ